MGLLDVFLKGTGDPDRDAAINNGLLQAGLALMQSRGRLFPAIGQAGQVGLQAAQQTRAQQMATRRAGLQDKLIQNQLGQQQREAELAALPGQFYRAPSQPAMDATGGMETAVEAPNNASGPGGFDMQGYIQALMSKSPMQALQMQAAMAKDNSPITVKEGETLLNRNTLTPVFTNRKAPEQSADYRDWLAEVQAGRTKLGYTEWAQALKASGATRVNVPVNTERTYAGNLAEAFAKQDAEAVDAARSAPDRIRSARQVKQILTTQAPITGTLAEQRLMLSKALATAGVISEDSAAATEALSANLANQALAAIKSSGLGAGSGFSNADRDFLERAAAGKIDMTQGALLKIADLNERAAVRAIEKGNRVIERLRGNPNLGNVRDGLESIQMPSDFRMPTAEDIAAEARRRAGGR